MKLRYLVNLLLLPVCFQPVAQAADNNIFSPNLIEPDAKYREGTDETTTPRSLLPAKKYLEEQDLIEFERLREQETSRRKEIEKQRKQEAEKKARWAEEARKALEARREEEDRLAEIKRQQEEALRKAEEDRKRAELEAQRVAAEEARKQAEREATRINRETAQKQLKLDHPFRPAHMITEYGAGYIGLYGGAIVGTGIGVLLGGGISNLMDCTSCRDSMVLWNARLGAIAGSTTAVHLLGSQHEKYAAWPVTLTATALPALFLPAVVNEDFNFDFAGPDIFYVVMVPLVTTMTYNLAWRYNSILPEAWKYKKRKGMSRSVINFSADRNSNFLLNFSIPLN